MTGKLPLFQSCIPVSAQPCGSAVRQRIDFGDPPVTSMAEQKGGPTPTARSGEDITWSIAKSLLRKVTLPADCLTSLTDLSDRPKKLHATMFSLLTKNEIKSMLPDSLKSMTVSDLKLRCLRKLEALTPGEIDEMIRQGE
ncbi:hypothetical protein BIW11_10634 [Tropilaelaps mercedesae]|uniref:Uncharacterized protein n=1 Tax=Tropilaelaps mercedesae TaxID=418985 RepID=A0A1V9XFB2_9ACAR|nr:hypothetical protein BIW11_10634 [Tropilaelaps mercedesae]